MSSQLMDNNLIVPGGAIVADNTLMKVSLLPCVRLDYAPSPSNICMAHHASAFFAGTRLFHWQSRIRC